MTALDLTVASSVERSEMVADWGFRLRPAEGGTFWRTVMTEWSGFDAIDHESFFHLFYCYRRAWTPGLMHPDDRAAYAALPGRMTVYRGADLSAPMGLSWTLDRDIAAGFAEGHRGMMNPCPAVFTATVSPADVAFMQTERGEREVVLFAFVEHPEVEW